MEVLIATVTARAGHVQATAAHGEGIRPAACPRRELLALRPAIFLLTLGLLLQCGCFSVPKEVVARERDSLLTAVVLGIAESWTQSEEAVYLDWDGADPSDEVLRRLGSRGFTFRRQSECALDSKGFVVDRVAGLRGVRMRVLAERWHSPERARVMVEVFRAPLGGFSRTAVWSKQAGNWHEARVLRRVVY